MNFPGFGSPFFFFFFFFFVGLWSQSADKLTIHSIPCSWRWVHSYCLTIFENLKMNYHQASSHERFEGGFFRVIFTHQFVSVKYRWMPLLFKLMQPMNQKTQRPICKHLSVCLSIYFKPSLCRFVCLSVYLEFSSSPFYWPKQRSLAMACMAIKMREDMLKPKMYWQI